MAFWIGVVGVAIAVVAAGVGSYQAVQKHNQDVEIAEKEGEARDIEARSRIDAAAFQERQERRRLALLMGKQDALIGSTMLDPGSGSPLFMALDTARQAELEALNIRRSGQVGAFGSQFESGLARFRAQVARGQVGQSIAGGTLGAAGAVARGVGEYQYRYGGRTTTTVPSSYGTGGRD